MVCIDGELQEILLADRLREKGKKKIRGHPE
jgi:hypothetical protein